MDIDKKAQTYWNTTERVLRTKAADGKGFFDNLDKRRVLIQALLDYDLANSKILGIGPGLGVTDYTVCGLNYHTAYAGLDISDEYAAQAKKLFKLSVTVGDASKLPYKTDTFDCLFAFDSFEHIPPPNKKLMYKEINRVMKPNRLIFINNPLSESLHEKNYEFGFHEADLFELIEETNTRLIEVKILEARSSLYQFIVLGSLEKKQ